MITFDIDGRQMGKTERMIAWMKQDEKRVCIVKTHDDAADMAKRAELPIARFIVIGGHNKLRGRDVEIGIEDLDRIIYGLLGLQQDISRISATGVNLGGDQ